MRRVRLWQRGVGHGDTMPQSYQLFYQRLQVNIQIPNLSRSRDDDGHEYPLFFGGQPRREVVNDEEDRPYGVSNRPLAAWVEPVSRNPESDVSVIHSEACNLIQSRPSGGICHYSELPVCANMILPEPQFPGSARCSEQFAQPAYDREVKHTLAWDRVAASSSAEPCLAADRAGFGINVIASE